MIRQKALVGKALATETVDIEKSLVARFVAALDLKDPLHSDAKACKSAGLSGLLLPEIAVGTMGDFDAVTAALEVKPKQVLHSQEKTAVFEPICVGDTIKITTSIHTLFEQQSAGNPMGFVTVEVIGEKGRQVVFQSQRVLAIRGGFPRR